MKKLLLLLPLAACITINQGGGPVLAGAPRAALMAEVGGDGVMAYSASAVLASYNLEKARTQTLDSAKAFEGEILKDGTELVVVRIPADKLTNYLEGLKKFGKVESFRIEGENMSRPMEDNALRIESLEKARAKYQELLSKAARVQDILAISRELEQIDGQLQYLQRQQQESDQRLSTAEVAVTLKKRSGFGPLGWILYIIWRAVKWFFWWG